MKLKNAILALAAASLGATASHAQTTLAVGDIQILGVTADDPDSFSFVLWKDVAATSVIRFTDNSFTSTAGTTLLSGDENNMTLTFGSALSAGTVIRFQNGSGVTASSGTAPTASGTLSGTANAGDQVFAYQGTSITSGNTSFSGNLLHGFNVANTSWLSSGTATNNASYLPSVLNAADASFDSDNFDNVEYSGVRTGLSKAIYRAAISNNTNYGNESDSYFDLSTTGFTINSSANIHWDANGTTSGDGGAGTWDTTTNDRFKNSASGTTRFRWVNSSTGNDHTAVFGGTAGAVSIASGGVTASGLQFDTNGYSIQSNTLTLAGSTPTISVTTAGHSATISSTLAGSTGLTKSGDGTLNITGTNSTDIGATSVAAGTLNVGVGGTGSLTSAVTVTNAGSKLGGSGTITGNVGIGSGAILAAGNSVGSMTVDGDLTLASNSIFEWELGSETQTGRGTSFDAADVTGTLDVTGSIYKVIVTGLDIGSTFWDADHTWDVFDTAATGTFASFELYNSADLVNSVSYGSQGTFVFDNTSGDLKWNFTAVPEPTSALAGLLIAAGLLRRRRSA